MALAGAFFCTANQAGEDMRILFVHQNFPAQYLHLAASLAADPANQVVAMSINPQPQIPGVRAVVSRGPRVNTRGLHPWLLETETKFSRGETTLTSALVLKQEGFQPDLICAHPGWGEALFLKDVWPRAVMLGYFEFFYHLDGADVGFDPEFPPAPDVPYRLRMKNTVILHALAACDYGVSPTLWQKQLHPAVYADNIAVIHDGIDTAAICPNPAAVITLNETVHLTAADEVITFIARNLEPYRGFHILMKALPELQKRHPRAHVLIVGDEGVSYGAPPRGYKSFKQQYLAEIGEDIDTSRIHFLGKVPKKVFIGVLQISSAHIYLTYPFVLSWSMLEAMAAGCLVIGSRTPPVEEVISHGENGLLVDFFSPGEIVAAVEAALADPGRMASLKKNARQTIIDRYDLESVSLPRHIALIRELTDN
jgi:glycosyltransferase involved in cell wall biosynthesis